jgi:hypothetical protein
MQAPFRIGHHNAGDPATIGTLEEILEERRLADARITAQHQHAATSRSSTH